MSINNNFLRINHQYVLNYYNYTIDSINPVIVFLHGYMSNILGTKANFIKEYCKNNAFSCLMLEYRGHGDSSGKVEDFSLQDWLSDVNTVINSVIKDKKRILIGSSMGGWLAFLHALEHKNFVTGLIGIAAALDFTADILSNEDFLEKHAPNNNMFAITNIDGSVTNVGNNLLNTSKELLILNKESINLDCGVRLLHGMKDAIVPYTKSIEISSKLKSNNVNVTLVKNGDHSLSSPEDLRLLSSAIEDLIN